MSFKVIAVSVVSDDLIQDLEAAHYQMQEAEGLQEVAEAYGVLCQRRKELYQRIAALEFNTGEERKVLRRFD